MRKSINSSPQRIDPNQSARTAKNVAISVLVFSVCYYMLQLIKRQNGFFMDP